MTQPASNNQILWKMMDLKGFGRVQTGIKTVRDSSVPNMLVMYYCFTL